MMRNRLAHGPILRRLRGEVQTHDLHKLRAEVNSGWSASRKEANQLMAFHNNERGGSAIACAIL